MQAAEMCNSGCDVQTYADLKLASTIGSLEPSFMSTTWDITKTLNKRCSPQMKSHCLLESKKFVYHSGSLPLGTIHVQSFKRHIYCVNDPRIIIFSNYGSSLMGNSGCCTVPIGNAKLFGEQIRMMKLEKSLQCNSWDTVCKHSSSK